MIKTAKEVRELTIEADKKIDYSIFESILRAIYKSADNGNYKVVYIGIVSQDNIIKLQDLGYNITIHADNLEYTIHW